MIPRIHKRGTSFKGVCGYILHDPKTKTADRVLWTDTLNIFSSVEDAWFEMFAVARDQAHLKRAAGRDARGRKNENPVLHYTLSWAANEAPSLDHMRETARSSLAALGLDAHQAVMAAHGDKQHLHVHIVVNTINPDNGITATLKFTKEKLSRWAEAYEQEHGIHCNERVQNNLARDLAKGERKAMALLTAGAAKDVGDASLPYAPVKHAAVQRPQWFDRKDITDRMKRLRAEMDVVRRGEREVTYQRHRRERNALDTDTKAAVDHARGYVRGVFKPRWRDLYRAHNVEMRFLSRTHTLERAVFVYHHRARLGSTRPLTLRQAAALVRRPDKLLDRVAVVHRREKAALAAQEKSEAKVYTRRIWENHTVKFHRLQTVQLDQWQAEQDAHHLKRRSVSLDMAKASLSYESQLLPELQNEQSSFKRGAEPLSPASAFAEAAAPVPPDRAAEIKRAMEQWRNRKPDNDFGREM